MAARTCSSVTPAGSETVRPSRRVITAPLSLERAPSVPPRDARAAALSPVATWRVAGRCAVRSFCTASAERPSTSAADPTSRWVRSAEFGTARTPSRWPTWTSTSLFIPGRSRPPRLSIRTSTGNIVTFCSVCACGSILSTEPSNGRLGYASTVTLAR